MSDSLRPDSLPWLVEVKQRGHYTLRAVAEFRDLLPSKGIEKRRIRLNVEPGIVLDLPLSEHSLIALADTLKVFLSQS
jgi:hypothetical protein